MKIIAIWDRHKVAPGSKSIFCLLDDQRLLFVGLEEEYQGKDKEDNRIYKETGNPEYMSAFKENDRFNFEKAHYFVTHFGATLLKKFTV